MSTRVGRAGDYLVASALEQIGVQVAVVHADNFDLCAWTTGDVYRIECKASMRKSKQRPNAYHFQTRSGGLKRALTTGSCDIVAFVALDIRMGHFRHISIVRATSTLVSLQQFTAENEIDSWLAATRQ